jgi:RNA polymerase sigma factor (sigma-70 family)
MVEIGRGGATSQIFKVFSCRFVVPNHVEASSALLEGLAPMAEGQLHRVVRHIRRIIGRPVAYTADDRLLLERFVANHDEAAFASLVERYGALVYGTCRRLLDNEHDAEDAFQATFLLLARKAGSMRWRPSISGWLYEVAYRTASNARVQAAKRSRHERQAGIMRAVASTSELDSHQLQQVLDAELHQLPKKYRMPLLLCYLHGQSREQTARQLGWTEGTLKGRLERGRELLRNRLTRRGLVLSAGALSGLMAASAVAAVPAALSAATVQAVTTGVVSAHVAALMKGVLQTMFRAKLRTAACVLVAAVAAIGSGAGFLVYRAGASPDANQPSEAETKTSKHEPIAWGEASNGLRLGLGPSRIEVGASASTFVVHVWYENVGKQARQVPVLKNQNMYPLMFAGTKLGQPFYVDYHAVRLAVTVPEFHNLGLGQRFKEEFTLTFRNDGGGFAGLPELAPGQALSLRAGLCGKGDTQGEKSWNLPDTLRSGSITVTRVAQAQARPKIDKVVKIEFPTMVIATRSLRPPRESRSGTRSSSNKIIRV